MVPDLVSIAVRRHRMRTILRCAALGLGLIFGIALLVQVANTLAYRPAQLSLLPSLREAAELSPFLIAAAALVIFERRLTVWLVPLARAACPGCEYHLDGMPVGRCPECGLVLGSAFGPDLPRRAEEIPMEKG